MSRTFRKRWLPAIIGGLLVVLLLAGALTSTLMSPRGLSAAPAEPLSEQEMVAQQGKLSSILSQSGTRAALDYMDAQKSSNPSVARSCHPLLHHLGREAYKQAGSFAVAMAQARELCNSGYVHGVIEAHFIASPSVEEALATSCAVSGTFDFSDWECFHGVGHGIVQKDGRQVDAAIADCQLVTGVQAVDACVNGVFMEAFLAVDHSGAMRVHDHVPGLGLCQKQTAAYKPDCYTYAPTAYLGMHDNRYSDAVKWCVASEPKYRRVCQSGVAAQALKENMTRPAIARGVCESLAAADRPVCIQSVVTLYIFQSGSSAAAKPLCAAEFRDYAASCQAVITRQHKLLGV